MTRDIIYPENPQSAPQRVAELVSSVRELLSSGRASGQAEELVFEAIGVAIELQTAPSYHVLRPSIGNEAVDRLALTTRRLLGEVDAAAPELVRRISRRIASVESARLHAEEYPRDCRAAAAMLTLDGLRGYVDAIVAAVQAGNLYRAAVRSAGGELATELGNDYAQHLDYARYCGATFATTNPVLITTAWESDPDAWNPIADRIARRAAAEAGSRDERGLIDLVALELTAEIVAENCRKLRGVFEATGLRRGYVSCQVDPRNHGDSRRMVADAHALYRMLEARLGGVPNAVIKLPATAAGLEAAKVLGDDGIGVTITLTFSLFQAAEFALVLAGSRAPVSYIAMMNGRLAFPVRDELRRTGADDSASRLAGVAVARKIYRTLYRDRGIDPSRVRLMIASLRSYQDAMPDIDALWGVPLITIFPNIRRRYDAMPRAVRGADFESDPSGFRADALGESEIFRQAWWLSTDGNFLRPKRPLSLAAEDSDAVAAWPPVAETLSQFTERSLRLGELVRARVAGINTSARGAAEE